MENTDKIKDALGTLIDLGMTVDKDLQDNHIDWAEGAGLTFKAGIGIYRIARSWRELQSELNQLTPEKRQEVIDYFSQNLDLSNDRIEKLIEAGFEVVFGLVKVLEAVRRPRPAA